MSTPLTQTKKYELTSPEAFTQTAAALDQVVLSGIQASAVAEGFSKAFITASAISNLKLMLTEEIMQPIMELQGSPLGFRSDKDSTGGYQVKVVRDCVITALLKGVQVTGNMFNIIAGRDYITKEGFTYLLKNFKGLERYSVIHGIPAIKGEKGAVVTSTITWTHGGKDCTQELDTAVRVNAGMGTDAILGKADRKVKCWLYNHLSGNNYSDADADDAHDLVPDNRTPGKYDPGKLPVKRPTITTTPVAEDDDNIPMGPPAVGGVEPLNELLTIASDKGYSVDELVACAKKFALPLKDGQLTDETARLLLREIDTAFGWIEKLRNQEGGLL